MPRSFTESALPTRVAYEASCKLTAEERRGRRDAYRSARKSELEQLFRGKATAEMARLADTLQPCASAVAQARMAKAKRLTQEAWEQAKAAGLKKIKLAVMRTIKKFLDNIVDLPLIFIFIYIASHNLAPLNFS